MTSKWFDEYTPSFTQSDYYNRSVLMKGMFHSFICEQFSNDKVLLDEKIQLIIHTTFSLFNIPNIKTEKVIIEAKNIILEKISIYLSIRFKHSSKRKNHHDLSWWLILDFSNNILVIDSAL